MVSRSVSFLVNIVNLSMKIKYIYQIFSSRSRYCTHSCTRPCFGGYYLGVEPFFRQTVTDPNLFCCPCLDFLASRATRGKVGDRRIWSQVTSSTTPLGCCDEEPGVGVVIVRWPATKKGLVHYPSKMIQAIQTIGNLIHLCLGATNILIGFSWQRTGLAVSPRACCLHLHINL